MPASPDYVEMIRRFDRDRLRWLWTGIQAGHTPGWPAGRAFEYLVLRAFELDGAEVRWPYEVRLDGELVEQVDGAIYAGELACLVEVKDTAGRTDLPVLAKLRTQLARRPSGTIGVVFSRSGFTPAAMALAGFFAPQTILLWPGEHMESIFYPGKAVATLRSKFRECVEQGMSHSTRVKALSR